MPDLPYAVLQGTDPVDLDPDEVARLEETRRIEADTDARRRAGRDDVAGAKRHACRYRGNDRRDVEDEIASIRALPDVAIDEAADAGVGEVDLVAGHRP